MKCQAVEIAQSHKEVIASLQKEISELKGAVSDLEEELKERDENISKLEDDLERQDTDELNGMVKDFEELIESVYQLMDDLRHGCTCGDVLGRVYQLETILLTCSKGVDTYQYEKPIDKSE
jgi:chromosome segregation ATPase